MPENNHFTYTNRLIHQKSPYLLQHAHNPVDWFSWSDEAFQAARASDKPIFLSIGYATCHWCHVMEKESFEDPHVAQLLNETFINIKVDREELPEIDGLYMEFAQSMMSGAAGWPLNVILTPELQPFFAATYLPPHSNHGMMGLSELVMRIREMWSTEERESVMAQAAQVVELFAANVHVQGEEMPEKEYVQDVADLLFKMADPVYGGMHGTPKFPVGYQYNFLLGYSAKENDSRALFLVERTLDMMERGGIYDHLGGGFSRYSVDEQWLIPHFEKMLYDNALLISSYLETWKVTKNPLYREVCEESLQYILREMTHPEGGFYSAQDADSEGHEGRFYTWTPEEIKKILLPDDAKLFCDFFDVKEKGNFEGRSVLHTKLRIQEFAAQRGLDPEELANQLKQIKHKVYLEREKREHPFKDDKILSSWNGLMIYSMVEAGVAFGSKKYIDAAVSAARFIRTHMWVKGQLLRRWRENEVQHSAGLDEYAFLIRGLLSLFEAGCGNEWLEWAMHMTQIVKENFKFEQGAFYQTDGTDPNVILRKCQFADGAEPSGNAIHTENLLRLYQMTADIDYLNQARDVLKAVDKYIESYAPGYCYHIMNINRYYDKRAPTIVIALNEKEQWKKELQELLYDNFIPHKVIVWRREGDKGLFSLLPFIAEQHPVKGKTTLYICHAGACQKPLNDLAEMQEAIQKM
jgi:uncharacterized protein YyaL (SSP411 family)